MLAAGHHLVTRVRTTAVAYHPAPQPLKRGRGRPLVYGKKVRLKDSWNLPGFVTAASPAYGEKNVTIRILTLDLLWRPVGRIVRFVLVDHPHRGRIILMTTHLGLSAIEIVRLYFYSYRFKIEICFKQAVHTVGAYAYRFWMKAMPRQHRGAGNQYLHRATPEYRARVHHKLPPTTCTPNWAASHKASSNTSPSTIKRAFGACSATGCAPCAPTKRPPRPSPAKRYAQACRIFSRAAAPLASLRIFSTTRSTGHVCRGF